MSRDPFGAGLSGDSPEDRWSLLQITRQLIIETRDDFRARLAGLPRNPADPPTPFE